MIHNPKLYDNTEWSRPADWLPIDHLATNGTQKIVGLYAIFPSTETYFHNRVCMVCRVGATGKWTVDWGDGTIDIITDPAVANHTYDYDTIPDSTLCSRGYKQAIITITSTGTLYGLYMARPFTVPTLQDDTSNWLDVKICGTVIANMGFTGGSSYTAKALLLEKLVVYQSSSSLTGLASFVAGCSKLRYCNLNGLNTSNLTTLQNAFINTSIKTLLFDTWDTGKVTTMSLTFANTTYDHLDLSNWSTNEGVVVGLNNMFFGAVIDKVTMGAFRHNGPFQQFMYIASIRELDFSRVISVNATTMANSFDSYSTVKGNLKTIDLSKFDAIYVSSIASAFSYQRMVDEVAFTTGWLTNLVTATNPFFNSSFKRIRLPQMGLSFTVLNNNLNGTDMNLLFGDLADANGAIYTMTNVSYGTGYTVGDILTVSGGNNDATLIVVNTGTGGVPNNVGWYNSRGTGYSLANNVVLTGGTGTGFIGNITALKTTPTITITGNPAATDPLTDRTIATVKNWTVVG